MSLYKSDVESGDLILDGDGDVLVYFEGYLDSDGVFVCILDSNSDVQSESDVSTKVFIHSNILPHSIKLNINLFKDILHRDVLLDIIRDKVNQVSESSQEII